MSGWRVLLLAATMSLGAAPAFAGHHFPAPPPPPPSSHGHGVPEIDPAGLGTAATLLAGAVLLVWSRRATHKRGPANTVVDSSRRYVPCFLLHAASFGALIGVSRLLFGGSPVSMSHPGAMVALWLGVVALTVGTWLTALLPPRVIVRETRARAGLIAGTAVLGLIAFLIGRLAQGLWMPLRQATFSCATFLLALLSPT